MSENEEATLVTFDTDGDGISDKVELDHNHDGEVDVTILDLDQDGQPDN